MRWTRAIMPSNAEMAIGDNRVYGYNDLVTALNWIAVVLSVAAVLITVRQVTYARQANHLPLFVDILREYRSLEFQRYYHYITTEFPKRTTVQPLSDLEDYDRDAALTVVYFFWSIAYLTVYGIMDEEMVMATLQTPIRRCWAILGPYIEAEREKPDRIGMFQFLEHIAVRAESTSIPKLAVKRRLQRHSRVDLMSAAHADGGAGVSHQVPN